MSETPKELRIGEVTVGVPLHGQADQLLCRLRIGCFYTHDLFTFLYWSCRYHFETVRFIEEFDLSRSVSS